MKLTEQIGRSMKPTRVDWLEIENDKGKWPGSEANHSSPTTAKVKNA